MLQRFQSSLLPPSNRLGLIACGVLAMLLRVAALNAAVIVNDTWRDGIDDDPASPTYSEAGVDSDADGDLESAWYQGGDGTLNPVGLGGPERGMFSTPTSTSSASWTTYFTPEGSEINLANAGDKMTVTWVFTPNNVNSSNSSQNFRIAVVDAPSASRLTANGAPGSAAYTGYGIFGNMAQTLGNGNPFELRERVPGSSALLSSSGSWTSLANGANSGNTGYTSGTQYTFTMSLTRTALGELQIDTSITGGSLNNSGTASVSFLDTSPSGFQYDTFSLRPSGATTTAETFDTSLFRVEFSQVPEPTSIALVGLGMLVAGWSRRRFD